MEGGPPAALHRFQPSESQAAIQAFPIDADAEPTLHPFLILLAVITGLVAGSFVNVVAHRIPLGRSVVHPASACPRCGSSISARDNIPVFGWLVLRGRCRACREPISVRYPVVEAAAGLLFLVTVEVVGLRWVLPAYLWFGGVTMALVLTDLDHKRLPNRIVYPGVVVGAALLGAGSVADMSWLSFGRALGGGAVYFGGLYLLALIARGGFGMGDVKMAALLGLFTAYVSWRVLAAAVFLAFGIGGAVAIGLMVLRKRNRKDEIPFGPSMIFASWIAVAYGETLVAWWLRR